MDAAETLQRIGYLLDRVHAEGYRAQAYHRAAQVIGGLTADEVVDRARTGRLVDLDHIGPKTAAIVEQVVAGQTPTYLAELEQTTVITSGVGAALLAQLRGDCHTHSTWSDGGADVATMARAARALGHEYLVLTDHSPRLRIANGLTPERLRRQLNEVAAVNEDLAGQAAAGHAPAFRILTGIEVDILDDGSLDQDDELLAELDVVVASVHSKLRMETRAMTRRMATAMANPPIDILGPCTRRPRTGKGQPESTFDAEHALA
ncbi:MAG: PHP domain-containing protein [Acidimicrobiales bacterium]